MLVGARRLIHVEQGVAFSALNIAQFFIANRVARNISAMDQNGSVNCISVQSAKLFSVLRVARTMDAFAPRLSICLMIRLLGGLSDNHLAPPHQMSSRHFLCDKMSHPVALALTVDNSVTANPNKPLHDLSM
jgi:hypothetical protein